MYPETKRAVRRVLRVCELLWSLPSEDYQLLLEATNAVEMPDRPSLVKRAKASLGEEADADEIARMTDDLILKELKRRYAMAAEVAGLEPEHGLAMLEYATILMDLNDEDDCWDA